MHTGEIEQWTLLIKQLKCTQERLNSEHYLNKTVKVHTGEIEQWTLLIKQEDWTVKILLEHYLTVKVHTGEIEQWTLLS